MSTFREWRDELELRVIMQKFPDPPDPTQPSGVTVAILPWDKFESLCRDYAMLRETLSRARRYAIGALFVGMFCGGLAVLIGVGVWWR